MIWTTSLIFTSGVCISHLVLLARVLAQSFGRMYGYDLLQFHLMISSIG